MTVTPEGGVVLKKFYRVDCQVARRAFYPAFRWELANEAVGSLHMYRDSIVQDEAEPPVRRAIVGAYLLTPHIPSFSGAWQRTKMPERLFHPSYRAAFSFGALTLRPGMSLAAIGEAFATVLRDAGINESEIAGQS